MDYDERQNPTLDDLVEAVDDLATLPDVYVRIKRVLDDPTSSHADIAEALGTDSAMTARVLRIANSAFYGRSGTLSTISAAVGLLGTQQVHDLVLATAVIQTFSDDFPAALQPGVFWRTSLLAGCAAKLLAEQCGFLDSERMFVAGLLAQVGQIPLFEQLPTQMTELAQTAADTGRPIDRLQRDRLGYDYADVGAALFAIWQLPPGLTTPIGHHTRPQLAQEGLLEAAIVHVSVALAQATSEERAIDQIIPQLDDQAWQASGLNPELLGQLQQQASELADRLTSAFLSAAA